MSVDDDDVMEEAIALAELRVMDAWQRQLEAELLAVERRTRAWRKSRALPERDAAIAAAYLAEDRRGRTKRVARQFGVSVDVVKRVVTKARKLASDEHSRPAVPEPELGQLVVGDEAS